MNISDTQKTRWMLGRKIAAGYLVVLVLMCAIAGVAINRFQAFEANLHSILDVEWRKTEAANTVSEVVANNSRMTMQQLLVVPTERAALRQAITDQRGKMIAAYQFLQESVDSEEGRGLLRDFEPLRRKFVQSQKRFEELLDQDLITEAQAELATNALPTVMQVQALTSQLTQAAANNAGIHGAEMLQAADRATWMIAGLAGLALAFGVWVAWRLTRAITQPLSQAVQVAQAVAAGDLSRSITITHYDETGQLLQALRTMNTGLAQIVGSVRQASTSIAAATSEIATGNTDLSSRTEEQASALEETSAAMQQVLATVMQNAGNSQQAFDLARRTATLAGEGGAVVTQAVQTMQSVSASSQQIADIVGLIEGIAFQTNILALNAAVEAARAGEQGRGFAVVASEVRALAGRSAQASKDIKQLIQTSVAGIGDGCALVEQAGTTMSHIVRSVQDVAQLLGEISSASQEQTAGLEQVKNAVLQMDHMTQQNAALVEEAAAAAHALEAQAQGLTRTVGRFQLSVGATDVGSATVTNRGVPKTPSRSAQRAAALSMS